MNFSDADSIHALSALLSQAQDEDTVSAMRVPSAHMTVVAKRSAPAKPQSQSKNIWEDSEILSEEAVQSFLDDRPCPRYEILYKQSVGTEDVFLGTTDKTPGSADCTHLVVKIHFPNATLSALDLHITKRRVHAESATHKLATYLPLPVDESKGNAKWDSAKHVLYITLPIVDDGEES